MAVTMPSNIDDFAADSRYWAFGAHEMRVVPPPVLQGNRLVTCICGWCVHVEWHDRADPDTPLHERITAAYRAHLLKDGEPLPSECGAGRLCEMCRRGVKP